MGNDDLTAEVVGDVETEGKVLVIKRIRVTYQLRGISPDQREAATRAHAAHADFCPVARSLQGAIDISTRLEFID